MNNEILRSRLEEEKQENNYSVVIGSIDINNVVWQKIFDNEKNTLICRAYGSVIAKILEPLRLFCIINFEKNRPTKKSIVIYARCKHKYCRKFKFELSKEADDGCHRMIVKASSSNINHGDVKLTRQCRGPEREEAKEKLCHQKPMQFILHSLEELDEEFAANGNMQGVKKACTIRKMRQEALRESLDRNQIVPVSKMRKKGQSSILKEEDP